MQQLILTIKQTVSYWKYAFNRFNYEPVWLLNSAYMPNQTASSFSIDDLMRDGFLWGVPKKRRTIERRLERRFGSPRYPQSCPIIRPRADLVVCDHCGDHHEAFSICRTCYLQVKEETNKLMEEIKSQTNPLEPKEKEIYFQFEAEEAPKEKADKFKVVEIARPRPNWFTKNLLARSSRPASGLRDVILNPEDTIRKN